MLGHGAARCWDGACALGRRERWCWDGAVVGLGQEPCWDEALPGWGSVHAIKQLRTAAAQGCASASQCATGRRRGAGLGADGRHGCVLSR
eukprot:2358960-Prymnesium_polylepis.1